MIDKHYRRKDVEKLTGLSRSTIYEKIKSGSFPKPVKLSARIVAWPESVIAKWLSDRAEAS